MPPVPAVLVTGASGLLGAHACLAAAARGMRVVGTVHLHPVSLPGVELVGVDLSAEAEVRALVDDVRPAWVLHCAAMTEVDRAQEHPHEAELANVEATALLARAAAAAGAGLVYVSTDAVYPGDRGGYAEDDPTGPVNVYARSKLAGEEAVRAAGPRHLVVRANLFGWNVQPKQSLAEWILAGLEAGGPVPGFADVCFNPLEAGELAGTLLDLAAGPHRGTVNAGASDRVSKYAFARMVAEVFGHDPGLVTPASAADAAFRAPRPRDTSMDVSRLTAWLGRTPPTVRAGIEQFRRQRDDGFLDRLKGGPAHATHNP
ncbi:MAG TPA: SDR family oxidoreductase [Longimicrobium sp.]|nr:SDR family oxidoreductase [Longimicrobium sp.]